MRAAFVPSISELKRSFLLAMDKLSGRNVLLVVFSKSDLFMVSLSSVLSDIFDRFMTKPKSRESSVSVSSGWSAMNLELIMDGSVIAELADSFFDGEPLP